jgi:hypothetical protein
VIFWSEGRRASGGGRDRARLCRSTRGVPEHGGVLDVEPQVHAAFARAWPELATIGQQSVDRLPWGHNLVLVTRTRSVTSGSPTPPLRRARLVARHAHDVRVSRRGRAYRGGVIARAFPDLRRIPTCRGFSVAGRWRHLPRPGPTVFRQQPVGKLPWSRRRVLRARCAPRARHHYCALVQAILVASIKVV